MQKAFGAALLVLVVVAACGCGGGTTSSSNKGTVILATTTSTEDSGIMDEFVKRFEAEYHYDVKPVAVGSGAALFMGQNGDADILLTHEPKAEKEFVDKGDAQASWQLMHNNFVIVGPPSDPAHIKGMTSGADAMKAIAASGSPFVSRGDASGTNAMEMSLWEQAGVSPAGQPWYIEAGAGMGETLRIAEQKQAYAVSDKATYTVLSKGLDLKLYIDNDPTMVNRYTVTVVNHEKFPGTNIAGALAFSNFLKEPSTRKLIKDFGMDKYKQHLFFLD